MSIFSEQDHCNGHFILLKKGTDPFLIEAVVEDQVSFCYYQSEQQPFQFKTAFVTKNYGNGYYISREIYYKSFVSRVKDFWFFGQNFLKWPETLQKSSSICFKTLNVCLTLCRWVELECVLGFIKNSQLSWYLQTRACKRIKKAFVHLMLL